MRHLAILVLLAGCSHRMPLLDGYEPTRVVPRSEVPGWALDDAHSIDRDIRRVAVDTLADHADDSRARHALLQLANDRDEGVATAAALGLRVRGLHLPGAGPAAGGSWFVHDTAPLNTELTATGLLRRVRHGLLNVGGSFTPEFVTILENGGRARHAATPCHPDRCGSRDLANSWSGIADDLGSDDEPTTNAALIELETILSSLVLEANAEPDIDAAEIERSLRDLGGRSSAIRRRVISTTFVATRLFDGFDERCRDRVTASVFDEDVTVREQAAEWLHVFGAGEHVREGVAAQLVDDETEGLRLYGLHIAADLPVERLADERWVDRIERALGDEREANVVQAITLLGLLPETTRREARLRSRVESLLESNGIWVRSAAYARLLTEDEMRERLLRASVDPDGRLIVRRIVDPFSFEHRHVATNVSLVGDLRDFLRLRNLSGGSTGVSASVRLLERLDERMILPDDVLVGFFDSSGSALRVAAMNTAQRVRTSETATLRIVRAGIFDDDPAVRNAAHELREARPELESALVVDLLESAVTAPSPALRRRCIGEVLSLGIDVAEAERVLAPLTRADDELVRLRAWLVLEHVTLQDGRAVAELRQGLESDDARVRVFAVGKLGEAGRAAVAAFPDLLPLINDENPAVSAAAVDAVQRLQPYLAEE